MSSNGTSDVPTVSWLFLSVARSEGGHLSQFFSAAEQINGSIPGNEEIEGGINRLASCGLIMIEGDGFRLSTVGRRLFDQAGGLAAFPRLQPAQVAPLLEKAMAGVEPGRAWSLDPDRASVALKAYRKTMAAALKSLE